MIDMQEFVSKLYRDGNIYSISFDTSYLDSKGYKFDADYEYILLNHLDKSIKILITDIVDREFINHTDRKIIERKEALIKEIRKAKTDLFIGNNNKLKEIERMILGLDTSPAFDMYDDFKNRLDIELVPVRDGNNAEIFDSYFNGSPPFSGKKKHEFPDAFR